MTIMKNQSEMEITNGIMRPEEHIRYLLACNLELKV
jgi:hypothetical protein